MPLFSSKTGTKKARKNGFSSSNFRAKNGGNNYNEAHEEAEEFGPCVLIMSTKGHSLFVNTNRFGAFDDPQLTLRSLKTFERRQKKEAAPSESRGDGRFSAGGHST